jgi:hypothetical protein
VGRARVHYTTTNNAFWQRCYTNGLSPFAKGIRTCLAHFQMQPRKPICNFCLEWMIITLELCQIDSARARQTHQSRHKCEMSCSIFGCRTQLRNVPDKNCTRFMRSLHFGLDTISYGSEMMNNTTVLLCISKYRINALNQHPHVFPRLYYPNHLALALLQMPRHCLSNVNVQGVPKVVRHLENKL